MSAEIWDTESANMIGYFETRAEALTALRDGYFSDEDLGLRTVLLVHDKRGRYLKKSSLSGPDLLATVRELPI